MKLETLYQVLAESSSSLSSIIFSYKSQFPASLSVFVKTPTRGGLTVIIVHNKTTQSVVLTLSSWSLLTWTWKSVMESSSMRTRTPSSFPDFFGVPGGVLLLAPSPACDPLMLLVSAWEERPMLPSLLWMLPSAILWGSGTEHHYHSLASYHLPILHLTFDH